MNFTANEASVLQVFIFGILFTSQISKCVNDNTKYQIEDDDNDDEKEQQVI